MYDTYMVNCMLAIEMLSGVREISTQQLIIVKHCSVIPARARLTNDRCRKFEQQS